MKNMLATDSAIWWVGLAFTIMCAGTTAFFVVGRLATHLFKQAGVWCLMVDWFTHREEFKKWMATRKSEDPEARAERHENLRRRYAREELEALKVKKELEALRTGKSGTP